MAVKKIAGKEVQVNDEGFMTNPAEWTKEIAVEMAKEEGIAELTPAHWKVIDFCRTTASDQRQSAHPAHHHHRCRCEHQGLFALFPKGPAKKVAKISGLGKPEGCV